MVHSSTALKTFRFRLYPTPEQQSRLNELLDLARWLYNHALAYRRKRWNESRKSVTYEEQCAMWRDWRNEQPEDNPLRLLNMSAGQQILRRLDSAYRQFLEGRRGKPRFKGKRFFNSLPFKPGNGAAVHSDGRLYIQNVGLVNIKWHRREWLAGTLKNIIVIRKPSGWYICFQVEGSIEPVESMKPPVGVDVGIYHALALSDGTVIDSPAYLKQSLKKLRKQQRRVARRQRGSKRREKAVAQVAKTHEHIANQRRDWWHKVVFWLVIHYGLIAIEDLNLAFMLRNEKLSRAAYDVGLGIFYEMLDYKAFEAGVKVVEVNPRDTSQRCSGCGRIVPKDLKVREHVCPHPDCGVVLDRDVNAALNILASVGTPPLGANVDPLLVSVGNEQGQA